MTAMVNRSGLSGKERHRHTTITMRIALLGWAVAIMSLTFFMLVTVPRQKEMFVNILASKANGLAASLHNVAAGAAVNEDYSSVVSAAQVLMKGDRDLEFLIVMKNNGFALVIEQRKWQVARLTDAHFNIKERLSSRRIEKCPLVKRRLFHFAQPFDYSGIQWGWIHVGLSVKEYDQSVAGLYRSTAYLSLIWVLISLIGSIIFARQIVRPILTLQTLVRRIAEGDLSVRVNMHRKDEIGYLAASVNSMADALDKKNRILEGVRVAAYYFLQEQSWEKSIVKVLEQIGTAAGVSRALLHDISKDRFDVICAEKQYEWNAQGVSEELEDPEYKLLCFEYRGIGHWVDILSDNRILSRSIGDCSDAEQIVLNYQGIQSLIVISVFVESNWWGILCLEDCVEPRKWTEAEISSFRALADMLGATIARQQFQKELIKAKDTLEAQVTLRTRELQEQVDEKEKALLALSDAQSSLVEMSRASGMAEVATGVLHNVGNVLNSVNVSATLIKDGLKQSRAGNLSKIAPMLDRSPEDLAKFLTSDKKGQQIPKYLTTLGHALSNEHDRLFSETESLADRIEHIKEIVSMQQNYGRVSGVSETIAPAKLMDDALMLNEKALVRHSVIVKKEYENALLVTVDKHKVLQILLNFINNAKYACADSGKTEKIITLKIYRGERNRICLSVADNGIGIVPENLTRIFQHGFTTRKSGHGFGLHSGALAARELGGNLWVDSEGLGKGAVFTLELPAETGELK